MQNIGAVQESLTVGSNQGRSQKFILGGYNFYCTILQSYILAA